MGDIQNRIESDMLGPKEICGQSYWGIHTQRAWENFRISGKRTSISLIRAMAMVKKAAAQANVQLGFLEPGKADFIVQACDEVAAGTHDSQFILDALQGGAGTSSNMNVNEVIANRALEISGREKGSYDFIHPIEHVNMHQSTNDVFPTALKIAVIGKLNDLSGLIARLQGAFQVKEREFSNIVKIGKTELQDAVPLTLGAEFSAFAETLSRDRWRMFKSQERIRTVNIGGTAVGTGLTAPRSYIFLVIEKLRQISGLNVCRAENLVDNTANSDSFVEISGIVKAHASNLIKIAQDLRLLQMQGQIVLPAVQAGSSIMPGKINPVVAEAVIQAGLKVIANDLLVTEAACRSSLQINEFMPLLAESILESLEILINVNKLFAEHVEKIIADEKKCADDLDRNTVLITAFIPHIGYEKAEKLIKEFKTGKTDICLRGFLNQKLGQDLVDKTLAPDNIIRLGHDDE